MKNLSLVLNVVLLVAVGVLYYLHFSGKTPSSSKSVMAAVPKPVITGNGQVAIAYVELDSLNENITYIKTKRKELEAEQRSIETEWENGYRGLEAKKDNFLKKGNAITQEMAQEFQGQLLQEQQQIDEKKQNLSQRLNEKSYKFMDDIQKKLKDFLAEYNSLRNFTYIFTTGTGLDYMVYKDSSLNITADVIAGMNEKMSAKAK
ncbi:MAG: OmpH family outer membrane protein [Ferruginibacter sp.]|jgi:outer membrane protein|nr:OmpH family outer membrane protein [Ferruginibacter sp.]